VSIKANRAIFERMKEDKIVCEALREFFEPEIEQRLKEANESGMQQGIRQGMQQGSDVVFDIQQKLKDGESKESLIGQGYEKSIVDKAYTVLFG
jgi:flagellar biosynthesis/type III secretory pathway protein FliH